VKLKKKGFSIGKKRNKKEKEKKNLSAMQGKNPGRGRGGKIN